MRDAVPEAPRWWRSTGSDPGESPRVFAGKRERPGVPEVGGALGLFLGFSFLGLSDLCQSMITFLLDKMLK